MNKAFKWHDFDHFYRTVEKRAKERLGEDFDIEESKNFFLELFYFSESLSPDHYLNPSGLMIHEIKKINTEDEYKIVLDNYKSIVKNRETKPIRWKVPEVERIAPLQKRAVKRKEDPIPDEPGLYFLFDNDKNLIYIGKSKNLRNRVYVSYIERDTTYIRIMATKNEADANILETYCIAIYSPLKNRSLKSGDKPTFTLELPELSDFIELKCCFR